MVRAGSGNLAFGVAVDRQRQCRDPHAIAPVRRLCLPGTFAVLEIIELTIIAYYVISGFLSNINRRIRNTALTKCGRPKFRCSVNRADRRK
jgi:hypothetical protein